MATALDIVDTAVKIGLGALISAVSTYFVMRKNQSFEKQTKLTDAKYSLLLEVSESFTAAISARNNLYLIIGNMHNGLYADGDFSEVFEMYKESCNHIGSAITGSYVIGDKQLAIMLENNLELINKQYFHVRNNRLTDAATFNHYAEELGVQGNEIRDQLSSTLESIYA